MLIGSSSGAATHLAALAGVPWLPQTMLVPVRHGGLDPDEPRAAVRGLAAARGAFLAANPQVGLHHMHDANQDRLMIRRMAYFRFKHRRLPAAYAEFLRAHLQPGGTVVVSDCGQRWPTTATGDRQVFQHGAVGGLPPRSTHTAAPASPGSSPNRAQGNAAGTPRPRTRRARRPSGASTRHCCPT